MRSLACGYSRKALGVSYVKEKQVWVNMGITKLRENVKEHQETGGKKVHHLFDFGLYMDITKLGENVIVEFVLCCCLKTVFLCYLCIHLCSCLLNVNYLHWRKVNLDCDVG